MSFWELLTAKRRSGWQSVDEEFVVEELPYQYSHKCPTGKCSRLTCDNRREGRLCIHTWELRGAMHAARLGAVQEWQGCVRPPKVRFTSVHTSICWMP
jgi:hypothetical protein